MDANRELDWQLPTRQASLFGKLPTRADYVRIRHSYPAAIALDEWTQKSLQELLMAGLGWPQAPIRFLFAPKDNSHALVGMMAPSQDRAGRKFPVTIFAPLPMPAVARGLARVPLACAGFFDGVEQLISALPSMEHAQIERDLDALPLPGPADWEQGQAQLSQALTSLGVQDFYAMLASETSGASSPSEAGSYAMHTLLTATADMREEPPSRATLLDCPLGPLPGEPAPGPAVHAAVWLAFTERNLRWRTQAPSFFWKPSPDGRLLLSLGLPPVAVAQYLAAPSRRSERLWSLRCERGELGRRAQQALQPALTRIANDAPTLSQLLDALAGWAP